MLRWPELIGRGLNQLKLENEVFQIDEKIGNTIKCILKSLFKLGTAINWDSLYIFQCAKHIEKTRSFWYNMRDT